MAKPFTKKVWRDARKRLVEYRIVGFKDYYSISVILRVSWTAKDWQPVEIRRSMGGEDGTITSIESETNFAAALLDAIEVAKKMQAWADRQNTKMKGAQHG